MAENSKIEWTTHTWNQPSLGRLRVSPQFNLVRKDVTPFTKSYPVFDVEAKLRKICERPDVVRIEIAAPIIAAMSAGKSVSPVYVISPAFKFCRSTQSAPLCAFAVDIARSIRATRCLLSRSSAYLRARLGTEFYPFTWIRTTLSSGAHFGATFSRHLFSLHWRNEGRVSFDPAFAGRFASRGCHG